MVRNIKRVVLIAGALILLTIPRTALAQDAKLTGTWDVSIDSPEGSFQMSWTLEQHDDGTISGTQTSDMIGEAAITDGWVDGDKFSISLFVEAQGEAFDIVYEGSFTEDEIFGDLNAGDGMFSAAFAGMRSDGGVR